MLGQNERGELHYAYLVYLRGSDLCGDGNNFLEEVLGFYIASVWHMFWPEKKITKALDMILDNGGFHIRILMEQHCHESVSATTALFMVFF